MRAAGFDTWASAVEVAGADRAIAEPSAAVEEATVTALTAFDAP
jgi:hypothetical protein